MRMIKEISAVILLFFLIQFYPGTARSEDDQASKIYSGYFHQIDHDRKGSLWHNLFGQHSGKQEADFPDRQCSVEFKSPVSFTHQQVTQMPDELGYFIRFKDVGKRGNGINGNGVFEKFFIKVYTNDDQVYTIDPQDEGKQVGIEDEHHIFDSYLIYVVLGQDIDHLEVVGPGGEVKGRYILDKLEVQDDD